MCHPKLCHFGIKIILSGRHWSSWNSLSASKLSLSKEPIVINLLPWGNSNLWDKKSALHPNRYRGKLSDLPSVPLRAHLSFQNGICFSLRALPTDFPLSSIKLDTDTTCSNYSFELFITDFSHVHTPYRLIRLVMLSFFLSLFFFPESVLLGWFAGLLTLNLGA